MARSALAADIFQVKWFIPEEGHAPIPICLQGRGGPCPLLALSNTLFMRRAITLPSGVGTVSQEALLNCIAEHPQAAAAEILDTLPSLASAVPVDIFFSGTTDFVPSRELDVFAALQIRLVHGAIPDPHDDLLVECISPLSYNQVCDKLVRAASQELPPTSDTLPVMPESRTSHSVQASKREGPSDSLSPQSDETLDGSDSGFRYLEKDEVELLSFNLPPHLQREVNEARLSSERAAENVGTSRGGSQHGMQQRNDDGTCEEPSLVMKNAMRVLSFIHDFSSMLTYHGLALLHETLKDHELTVLFYNNHFSVLTKHNGKLYTLVTDDGFASHSSIIWEQLSDLDGNSVFCDAMFRPSAHAHTRTTGDASRSSSANRVSTSQNRSAVSPRSTTASQRVTSQLGRIRQSSLGGRQSRGKNGKGGSGCTVQ